ncbi:hypothetical protein [Kutzneria buriramensis]|uniref:Uncharacterized protein n=1 Tax=Kutzneria buriramensis TaxID=1045776 RepID=A0A3E0HBX5_9PSEU|nr:hypothetical protein [Kutzneria buriramensis]REH41902.1 hypothetical protein BCF44_111206 [Kutzneria buriramensis]
MTTPHATSQPPAVNHRVLAMLRAVDAGRAQLTCSAEPDLFVDGMPCCDQFTAHVLAHEGLVRPGQPGTPGQRVPAVLTTAGRALVTGAQAAA